MDPKKAVLALAIMLIETVKESPDGAPGGILFAALMTKLPNITADQFGKIMNACCATGQIRKQGECYFPA